MWDELLRLCDGNIGRGNHPYTKTKWNTDDFVTFLVFLIGYIFCFFHQRIRWPPIWYSDNFKLFHVFLFVDKYFVSVLMIQRYSTKNSIENRCDQLAEACDEVSKRWEIKKLMTAKLWVFLGQVRSKIYKKAIFSSSSGRCHSMVFVCFFMYNKPAMMIAMEASKPR